MELGKRLKEYRVKLNMTQDILADKLWHWLNVKNVVMRFLIKPLNVLIVDVRFHKKKVIFVKNGVYSEGKSVMADDYKLGVDFADYILKPLKKEELLAKIDKYTKEDKQ